MCRNIRPRRWGSAIVPYNGLALTPIPLVPLGQSREAHELDDSHPGCCMVANATLPDGSSLTLVSIYGLFSDRTLNGQRYVPTTLHRILSDLTPILDTARNPGRRVIVGGDLNISPQVPAPDTRHHELVIKRIKAFGLVDCLGKKHTDFVRTHRPKNKVSAIPWQDD